MTQRRFWNGNGALARNVPRTGKELMDITTKVKGEITETIQRVDIERMTLENASTVETAEWAARNMRLEIQRLERVLKGRLI